MSPELGPADIFAPLTMADISNLLTSLSSACHTAATSDRLRWEDRDGIYFELADVRQAVRESLAGKLADTPKLRALR
jgi:hypothetical protein